MLGIYIVILGLFTNSLAALAQQLYPGNFMVGCNNTGAAAYPSAYLYTCNGEIQFCRSFMIFRSQQEYNSVTTISKLTSSSPEEIARINNVSMSAFFPFDKEVIVPVNCSCSNQYYYYQANASYVVHNSHESYFSIANDTYQGLSTCDALENENFDDENDVEIGINLKVPLRCACPTKNQTTNGVNYLLTYLITWNDTLERISNQFNVTVDSLVNANGFLEEDETIFPFTTLLIPLFKEPSSSQTIVPSFPVESRPEFTSLSKNNKTNSYNYKGIYIGIAVGSTMSVVFCVLFLVFSYHKGRKVDDGASGENKRMKKSNLPENILTNIANDDQMLKIYEFKELEAATESFTLQKRLSDSVYRGVLRGKSMAIKKMSKDVKKDVHILQKLNHFNVITLCGACQKNDVYYLVYEFMENRSLKEWLHENSNPEIQSWKFRIRIALDVASGLEYLHNFTYPAYVHRDLNSSNILLNGDLRAKITNFSCARSSNRIQAWTSASRLYQGTKGYAAPEFAETGEVTPKMDVYAFGVVLMELITGKEAVFEWDGEEIFLSDVAKLITDGENEGNSDVIANLIDPRLQVKHPLGYIIDQTEVAVRLAKLSGSCLEPEPERRISMAEVVSSLSKVQLDMQNHDSLSIE